MGKLTKWEAGQELIKAADALGEVEQELSNGGYPELAKAIRKDRLRLGKMFNQFGSHVFGMQENDRNTVSVPIRRGKP